MHKRLLFLCLALGITFASSLSAQNLVSIEFRGFRTLTQMTVLYGPLMQNGIEMHRVLYETYDINGQLDTASGLLVVPVRDEESIYPLLVYQHGTVDGPDDVPSNLAGGWELGAIFGGLGYVSLAPDFLGAGESRGFHPYVHADTEASAAADMVRAIRAGAAENDILINDQIFVTGYSQGGHASMALHRSMELEHSDEFTVTAASHMSGPYSIGDVMREVIIGDQPYYYSAYVPNTFLSYNYVYGIYDSTVQVFKQPYADWADNFFNGSIGLSTLNGQLTSQLTTDHGAPIARFMLQDSIVAILEGDDTEHPLRQALSDNDVYQWAPQAPTRLLYCTADDQVYFRNSIVADSVMNELAAADVEAIDLNPNFDHGQCVEPAVIQTAIFFGQFAQITVDAEEPPADYQLEVFPNPASNYLQIKGLKTKASVSLYAMDGRLLMIKDLESADDQLSINTLPNGVYLLRAEGEGIQYTEEVLIQR